METFFETAWVSIFSSKDEPETEVGEGVGKSPFE
jgi:hypothetical protein